MNDSHFWRNSEFSTIDANQAAEELERIRKEKGALKPAAVVEAARDENNLLHAAFPWDDSEAARIGRESIAARLIRSIRIEIITPDKRTIDTRAFVSHRDPKSSGSRSYIAFSEAMDSQEGRNFQVQQAWLALKVWRKKYEVLTELADLFQAVDSVLEKTKAG